MNRRLTAQEREVELHIPSELGWERVAMDVAASVARCMGFPPERVEDIRTAVSEATLNAIEHGNQLDLTRHVHIAFVPEREVLQISVSDQSTTRYLPSLDRAKRPNIEAKLGGYDTARGWGTFLISALVDEVEYSSNYNGNIVRMVIHLEPQAPNLSQGEHT